MMIKSRYLLLLSTISLLCQLGFTSNDSTNHGEILSAATKARVASDAVENVVVINEISSSNAEGDDWTFSWDVQYRNNGTLCLFDVIISTADDVIVTNETIDGDLNTAELSTYSSGALYVMTISPLDCSKELCGLEASDYRCSDDSQGTPTCSQEDVLSLLSYEPMPYMIDVWWLLNIPYSNRTVRYEVSWIMYEDQNQKFTCTINYWSGTEGICGTFLERNTLYSITINALSDDDSILFSSKTLHVSTSDVTSDTVQINNLIPSSYNIVTEWEVLQPTGDIASFDVIYYKDAGGFYDSCTVDGASTFSTESCDIQLDPETEFLISVIPRNVGGDEIGVRADKFGTTLEEMDGNVIVITDVEVSSTSVEVNWTSQKTNLQTLSSYQFIILEPSTSRELFNEVLSADATSQSASLGEYGGNTLLNIFVKPVNYDGEFSGVPATENACGCNPSGNCEPTCEDELDVISILSFEALATSIDVAWILNVLYSNTTTSYKITWVNFNNDTDESLCSVSSWYTTYGVCLVNLNVDTLYNITVEGLADDQTIVTTSQVIFVYTSDDTSDLVKIGTVESQITKIIVEWTVTDPTDNVAYFIVDFYNDGNLDDTCQVNYTANTIYSNIDCDMYLSADTTYIILITPFDGDIEIGNRASVSSSTLPYDPDYTIIVSTQSVYDMIHVQWMNLNPSEDVASYVVKYSVDGEIQATCHIDGLDSNSTEDCTEIYLLPNTLYGITVSPLNDGGEEIGVPAVDELTTSEDPENIIDELSIQCTTGQQNCLSIEWKTLEINENTLDKFLITFMSEGGNKSIWKFFDPLNIEEQHEECNLNTETLYEVSVKPVNVDGLISGIWNRGCACTGEIQGEVCTPNCGMINDVAVLVSSESTVYMVDVAFSLNSPISNNLSQFNVSWTELPEEVQYICSLPYNEDGDTDERSTVGGCESKLSPNRYYGVAIVCLDDFGEVLYSSPVRKVFTDSITNDVINNVTAVPDTFRIDVSWDLIEPSGAVTYFLVEYYDAGNIFFSCTVNVTLSEQTTTEISTTSSGIASATTSSESYTTEGVDITLEGDTQYIIIITPFNSIKEQIGSRFSVGSSTDKADADSLEIQSVQPVYDMIHLQWINIKPSGNISTYTIEYSVDGEIQATCHVNGPDSNSTKDCTDTYLLPNTLYNITVYGNDETKSLIGVPALVENSTISDPRNVIVDFTRQCSLESSCQNIQWSVDDLHDETLSNIRIEFESDSNATYQLLSPDSTTFENCNLLSETLYKINILPMNSDGLISGIWMTEQSCTGPNESETCKPSCGDTNDVVEILSLETTTFMVDVDFVIHEPLSRTIVQYNVTWQNMDDIDHLENSCLLLYNNEKDHVKRSTLGECESMLEEGKYYGVIVQALDSNADVISSSVLRKVFTENGEPDTVENVTVIPKSYSIHLTWDLVSPSGQVEKFAVQYFIDGDNSYTCNVSTSVESSKPDVENQLLTSPVDDVLRYSTGECEDMALISNSSYIIVITPLDAESKEIGSRYSKGSATLAARVTTLNVTYVTGETTPIVILDWDEPQANVLHYTIQIYTGQLLLHQSPNIDETSFTFDTSLPSGVRLIVSIRTTYSEHDVISNFTIIIPSSLSAVSSGLNKSIISWAPSYEMQIEQVISGHNNHTLTDADPPVVELDNESNIVEAVLVLSEPYLPITMRSTISVKTQIPEQNYPGSQWKCVINKQCPEDCTQSLYTQVPSSNSNADSFYESCHPRSMESILADTADNYLLNENTYIDYAQFYAEGNQCNMHSTLSLLRFWSHCKDTNTTIASSLLKSYFVHQQNLGSDCSIDFRQKFIMNYVSNHSCPESYCDYGAFSSGFDCLKLTSENLTFAAAREECLRMGGNLAHYTGDFANVEELSTISSYWVLGISSTTNPVLPYIPSELLAPMRMPIEDYFEQTPSERQGLCSLPPITDDIQTANSLTIPECTNNPCQNDGVCYPIENNNTMCSCKTGNYGSNCENDGTENEDYFEVVEEYEEQKNLKLSLNEDETRTIYVEYAEFGSISVDESLSRNQRTGCFSPVFLQVLQTRCNGRKDCELSHDDARNFLPSSCPRMVLPKIKVRYSARSNMTDCPREAEKEVLRGVTSCYQPSKVSTGLSSELMDACFAINGDLLRSTRDMVYICNKIDDTVLYYSNNSDFRTNPNFRPPTVNTTEKICEKEDHTISSVLCLVPLKELIKDTEPEKVMCESKEPYPDTYEDYFFPESEPGMQYVFCPAVMSNGFASWECGAEGEWIGEADMKECTMLELESEYEELTSDNRSTLTYEIINNVNLKAEAKNDSLYSGDVINAVLVMSTSTEEHAEDIAKAKTDEEKKNVTETMLDNTSELADVLVTNPSNWIGTGDVSVNELINNITTTLQNVSLECVNYMDQKTKTISHETVDMQVVRRDKNYFENEESRTFSSSDDSTKIVLPENFYVDYELEDGSVGVTFTSMETWHCLLNEIKCKDGVNMTEEVFNVTKPGQLNSYVMAADVGVNGSWNAGNDGNVTITFKHIYNGNDDEIGLENVACVFWDTNTFNWSTTGCSLVSTSSSETTCSCSHLTNLAVIMDINGKIKPDTALANFLEWVTIIGCSISLVCLAATSIILLGIPSVRVKGSNIVRANICINLFLAELILLCGLNATGSAVGCGIVAALLHYFFLSTFCWTALESFSFYFLLVQVSYEKKRPSKFYYAFGYGAPLLFVGITLAATQAQGYGTEYFCWLDPEMGLVWAFTGPLAAILLVNLVAFVMIVKTLCQNSQVKTGFSIGRKSTRAQIPPAEKKKSDQELLKKKIYGSILFFFTLGLTWILGFFYMGGADPYWSIPFTVLNSVQGLVIFVLAILRDDSIMEEVKIVLRVKKRTKNIYSHSSSAKGRSGVTSTTTVTKLD